MQPMEPTLNSTTRFSDRVDNYVKYRPHYPAAAYAFMKDHFKLGKASSLVDVGSGTGISTGPFLKMGCTVYAVEPNAEMRVAAEREFSKSPGFKSVDGTAEKTNLPDRSVDLILCAQAFHWFDAEKSRNEFMRVRKPSGAVVLMWNNRLEVGTPFLEAYEKLLQTFGTDYGKVKRQNVMHNGSIEVLFKNGFDTKSFPNAQYFDYEGLKGRLLSSSYAPNLSHPNHIPMMRELESIFKKYSSDGQIEMLYDTTLYFGKL